MTKYATMSATIYSKKYAENMADALNDNEPEGWEYKVEALCNEKARIAVFDETGEKIAYF